MVSASRRISLKAERMKGDSEKREGGRVKERLACQGFACHWPMQFGDTVYGERAYADL